MKNQFIVGYYQPMDFYLREFNSLDEAVNWICHAENNNFVYSHYIYDKQNKIVYVTDNFAFASRKLSFDDKITQIKNNLKTKESWEKESRFKINPEYWYLLNYDDYEETNQFTIIKE